ncbi:Rho GTPase-activating protein 2 [Striga hermonthica]|uniref:Rho GTPase-activating protein 2 n=1 Tax=Striga hermonthica TaxID=68872 RepID=A0A9N7N813_STRHE|nr:Rho GTPase-activating protein 2 [Striga hermonthica]
MTGRVFMVTGGGGCGGAKRSKPAVAAETAADNSGNKNLSLLDFVVSALRKSMVSKCRQDQEAITPVHHQMEIGWPTDVRHVTHVTFDKFHGFLGLPVDYEVEIPCQPPSASVSVCGVSANSMQWSYDTRCNSVPTILLMMQERLYALGGLKAEGIFRINPENGKEEYVKAQLSRGIVPQNIDVHCLAGLIKAWFRELPNGVLDGLSPEQVLQCNKEEEFVGLIKQLKPTESCLLEWAIDLMADVVEQEESNKMNARNIAMVFAPNMTKMSDPLTALMHAVQVMNLLKTLILKKLRERKEAAATTTRSKPLSSSHFTDRQQLMDSSCESTCQDSDNDDEDEVEVESLASEIEDRFVRPSDENENPRKDDFRKQLERILCNRENASPIRKHNRFYADSCVSFSDSRVGSSCISTSDDDEARLSSIAFRSRDGCKKRSRHGSRDRQYLLTNNSGPTRLSEDDQAARHPSSDRSWPGTRAPNLLSSIVCLPGVSLSLSSRDDMFASASIDETNRAVTTTISCLTDLLLRSFSLRSGLAFALSNHWNTDSDVDFVFHVGFDRLSPILSVRTRSEVLSSVVLW